ncbi:hypothetical protein V6O07_14290, partial [Arthrospira platensis SPKY2]
MGLVKNRAKNGDFYWVNAYITPITFNGEVIGYELVRRLPKRNDINRAEKLYKKINKYGYKKSNKTIDKDVVKLVLGASIAFISYLMQHYHLAFWVALLAFMFYFFQNK